MTLGPVGKQQPGLAPKGEHGALQTLSLALALALQTLSLLSSLGSPPTETPCRTSFVPLRCS